MEANQDPESGSISLEGFLELSPAARNILLDCATVLRNQPAGLALEAWAQWWHSNSPDSGTAFAELKHRQLVTLNGAEERILVPPATSRLLEGIIKGDVPDLPQYSGSRWWFDDDGQQVQLKQVRIKLVQRGVTEAACHLSKHPSRMGPDTSSEQ